jgi:hypothetical protein
MASDGGRPPFIALSAAYTLTYMPNKQKARYLFSSRLFNANAAYVVGSARFELATYGLRARFLQRTPVGTQKKKL